MRELPTLFSTEMVRLILNGRKTQTRRPLRPQPVCTGTSNLDRFENGEVDGESLWMPLSKTGKTGIFEPRAYLCPYGRVGDRLWVRETWRLWEGQAFAGYEALDPDILEGSLKGLDLEYLKTRPIEYKADSLDEGPWRPSIFMPKWVCRIFLEITDIRVQRLNQISEEDAIAEGFESTAVVTPAGNDYIGQYPSEHFYEYWEVLNGKKPGIDWLSNPWVWAITFKKVEKK